MIFNFNLVGIFWYRRPFDYSPLPTNIVIDLQMERLPITCGRLGLFFLTLAIVPQKHTKCMMHSLVQHLWWCSLCDYQLSCPNQLNWDAAIIALPKTICHGLYTLKKCFHKKSGNKMILIFFSNNSFYRNKFLKWNWY